MPSEHRTTPPDALLFLAPGCPHCPAVLEGVAQLLKEGVVGSLEAVNLAVHPERAQALGVKTVPWLRIGIYELEGMQPPAKLRHWAQGASDLDTLAGYFHDLLISGRRKKVEDLLKQNSAYFRALPRLMTDAASSMAVRLGLGAVLEEFQPSGLARVIVDEMGELTRHADALTRADACHFLSLIGGAEAIPYLRACLDDSDAGVREIAGETLAEMEKT